MHETLLSVLRQRRLPGQVIVSVPGDREVLPETRQLGGVSVIHCALGSSRQRNCAIDALAPAVEVVAFLDDDVELDEGYLERVVGTFRDRPDVVLVDGRVLADGPNIPRSRAREIVATDDAAASRATWDIGPELAYGCNMTVRRRVLARTRFDERLPLYGYMEDRDFAFECARLGQVARCGAATLVHLRPPSGRISARRFGFSQIMNPSISGAKATICPGCTSPGRSPALSSSTPPSLWLPAKRPAGSGDWRAIAGRFPTSCAAESRRRMSPGFSIGRARPADPPEAGRRSTDDGEGRRPDAPGSSDRR